MRFIFVTLALCLSLPAQWTAGKPEDSGYSSKKLEAVRAWLGSLDTTSMVVIADGKLIFQYGDVHHVSYLASARKTLLALLYGNYVDRGVIDLGKSLKEIGINDIGGLSELERKATIEDVISARSGIYHPASNAGDSTASAPPRGSQAPGTYYLYNNWDFNAAGSIFEKLTGKSIYDAFEAEMAKPLGMEDFKREAHKRGGDKTRSEHMAYHFHLSTLDMARVGQMMLQRGKWNSQQLVPERWLERVTSLVTPMNEMEPPTYRALGTGERWGYGFMTWVWDAPRSSGPFVGMYQANGAGGQRITVIPRLRMVVAHKVDTGQDSPHHPGKRGVRNEYMAVLQMLVNSGEK